MPQTILGTGPPIRRTFARVCRETRVRLGISQERLAAMAGVSRGHIARIELGRANPSLDLVVRIASALGLEIDLVARAPLIIGRNQRDAVHARCSGYADRRMREAGWLTAREVEIVHARSHGWIDLLAFDPTSGMLIVIEIKTSIHDLGEVERQIGWYERSAASVAERLGWRPRRVVSWLLVLATDETDAFVRANRDIVARAFPRRATEMSALVTGGAWPEASAIWPQAGGAWPEASATWPQAGATWPQAGGAWPEASATWPQAGGAWQQAGGTWPQAGGTWPQAGGRGLALIDPRSRRREWLIRCRSDGRRSAAPFIDHADAARRLAA